MMINPGGYESSNPEAARTLRKRYEVSLDGARIASDDIVYAEEGVKFDGPWGSPGGSIVRRTNKGHVLIHVMGTNEVRRYDGTVIIKKVVAC
jgi:hypothetical protein